MSEMIVRCLYDQLVPIDSLRLNKNNRNKHSKAQLERLAQILKYQGWRYCVKVSNQTGMVSSGHGRVEAAILNGWTEVPVNFQDYDDPGQEYSDSISDNSIASWSELDLSGIDLDIGALGPELNLDLLGIKNFGVIPPESKNEDDEEKSDKKKPVITQCPNCGECFDANENKP